MASPLTPANDSALNSATPQTTNTRDDGHRVASSSPTPYPGAAHPGLDQENMSPSPVKQRHSRVISGNELSPLKILSDAPAGGNASPADKGPGAATRSPRKSLLSPVRRFPVRVSPPVESPAGTRTSSPVVQESAQEGEMTLDEAIRENSGHERAIPIFEDDDENEGEDDTFNVGEKGPEEHEEAHPGDDTMASTFSTFSAVPSMTMFAKLGQDSPSRTSYHGGEVTPRGPRQGPPSRASTHHDSSGTTNNLLEFTDHLRHPQKTPRGSGSDPTPYNPSSGAPPSTPGRQGMNLIDFEIPPMPTPRSVPSITPRELESLKSNMLSEISSLKASMSGKEAEVQSLKTAVADAERRAGQNTEELREEREAREAADAEREGWEVRGREMEGVLRKAKEEIVMGQREREELEVRLEEADKRREAAEMMAQEAESKMAGMRAGKASEERTAHGGGAGTSSAREVEAAVEKVARELHALYKSKHETKVSALRKSYENRWERRVRELEARMAEVAEENERLRLGRDATMTRVDPALDEERRERAARDSAHIRELAAEVQKVEAVLATVRADNGELRADNGELRGRLEQERVEKGELVQLAEELMAMQATLVAPEPPMQQREEHAAAASPRPRARPQSQPVPPHPLRTPAPSRSQQAVDGMRGSISRASGLKAPGSYSAIPESRIGRGAAAHERTRSNGLPRPGQKSGLQSAIERMGSQRRE